jgi:superfamily I DNA/RNA helicase
MNKEFKPSVFQQAVFDFISTGEGSAIVEAVAGSGKSSTILQSLKLIPSTKQILFLAFNKSIAEELKSKAPAYVNCMTMNALGHKAVMKRFGRVSLDANKTSLMIEKLVKKGALEDSDARSKSSIVKKLVGIAKSYGIVPKTLPDMISLMPDTNATWEAMISHFDIEIGSDEMDQDMIERLTSEVIDMTRLVLHESVIEVSLIDFNDQLYFPVIYGLSVPTYDWTFVDEAQDISPIQRALLVKAKGKNGRLVAVGDPCQPKGTLVKVVVNKKGKFRRGDIVERKIEDLKIGDLVVSFDLKSRSFVSGRMVEGITEKPFKGDLVVVSTGSGLVSKYTPNHKCVVSFNNLKGKWCTYLMMKSGKFRVGKTKLNYNSSGSGVVARMKAERADAVWILKTFNSDVEATIHEKVISANYGLPQIMFKAANNSSLLTQSKLNLLWSQIEDQQNKASKLLSDFGRDIKYPIFTKTDVFYKSLKRAITCHASNIMDGCSVLPFTGKFRKPLSLSWETVTVGREFYSGSVYSMTIGKDHTYVGDGITTHNCQAIYGFRGADSASLQNIAKTFNCVTLPLSISYRCPKAVVREAQRFVSHIQSSETAPEGIVQNLGEVKPEYFKVNDMVVCRSSAPIVELAYTLISKKIPAKVMGREIGDGLISLIKKLKARSLNQLQDKLNAWKDKEVKKLLEKDPEANISKIEDKYECLNCFIKFSGADTVEGVIAAIQSMFGEASTGVVMLSTIHKSKGLEAKRVFVLDAWRMPSKYATKPHQIEQEHNLFYVAVTRAQEELYYVDMPKKKKGEL